MGRLRAPRSPLAPAPARAPTLGRGSARERGYDAAWDRASRQFLREHPLCRGCLAMGLVRPSALTDHVVPHKGDRARFWDRSLWQASCRWHHDVVKQMLERMFEAGELGLDDLWLDSPVAIDLARQAEAKGGGSNL